MRFVRALNTITNKYETVDSYALEQSPIQADRFDMFCCPECGSPAYLCHANFKHWYFACHHTVGCLLATFGGAKSNPVEADIKVKLEDMISDNDRSIRNAKNYTEPRDRNALQSSDANDEDEAEDTVDTIVSREITTAGGLRRALSKCMRGDFLDSLPAEDYIMTPKRRFGILNTRQEPGVMLVSCRRSSAEEVGEGFVAPSGYIILKELCKGEEKIFYAVRMYNKSNNRLFQRWIHKGFWRSANNRVRRKDPRYCEFVNIIAEWTRLKSSQVPSDKVVLVGKFNSRGYEFSNDPVVLRGE